MKLRRKFMSLALPGLLIFFIIGIIIILEKEKRDFIDQGKEKASLFASVIVEALQDNMLEGRPDLTVRLIKNLREIKDVYDLDILKEDGTRAFEAGSPNIDDNIRESIREGLNLSFMRDIGGRKALTFLKPLRNEERCRRCHNDGHDKRGYLLLSTSMEGVYRKIEFNRLWLVMGSFPLALTIAFLSAFFIRKVILKPVDILSEGVESLGKGNLEHRIEVSGRDELKDLANAFNNMAVKLKDSYSSLEGKVSERTKDLRHVNYELDQIAMLSTTVFRGNLFLKEIFISFFDVIIHNLGYYGAILYLIDKENKTLRAEHYKRLSLGELNFPDVIPLKGEHFLSTIALEGKITILENNAWFRKEGSTLTLIPILARIGKRCWEEVGCTITECPAYKNPDLRCWLIQETRCCSLVWEKDEKGKPPGVIKIGKCILCPQFPLIGVLGVSSLTTFSEDSIYTLEILTSELAAAIENANLIEKIKKDKGLIEGVLFSMNSGLLLLDINGLIQKINLVGSEILKRTINELHGFSITDIFPGSEEFLKVNSQSNREFYLMLKDGTEVPIGFNNSYLYSASGEPEGIIIVFRDLTEIKAMQNELREKERFATIGRVAAGVAHEIRNPLSGISSVAQILKKEIKDNPTHYELLDAMLSEINRLNFLIKELLVYGKPLALKLQETDLTVLTKDVVSSCTRDLGDRSISFREDSAPHIVRIDPERIKQVLLNILNNAIDATNHSGKIEISLESKEDGFILLKVIDNGAGIPEGELERVFDLFYTTKEKGTGLGLPICKKIMEDHGGNIEIERGEGTGTSVILRFAGQKVNKFLS